MPMTLGFNTAIVPELALMEVLDLAAELGYSHVEVMCWPPGKAERRYAGVTHLDVESINATRAAEIQTLCARKNVAISALGYYPNPLSPDAEEAKRAVGHLRKVIEASALLGINLVTTFVGRDPQATVEANWPRFLETWGPLLEFAESQGVRVGIENCPMLFTADEWPGGKNLAVSPEIWRAMFTDLPSPSFGLNYDPSHLVWLGIDPIAPLYEFKDRIYHVHAKDARIDRDKLNRHGILAYPNLWHTPKLPGMGEIRWGAFVAALAEIGYQGPIVVEVEDRAYERSFEARRDSLIISRRALLPYVAG
ncbi:Xylose isomerase domain-containing protein TIM barrel [Isosphaera pallida ATCC 43644]|uniref:Xylose isomerase domain-containing protein TIM barrel n=2 Tax=Isosphaera pallida TaxID=128 RepID=E8R2P9_ISOPI|nr:sugar phosphate isomerase/epimerase family protein [Isosphaera pallida]ADV63546.1 Xylose isomerase domain-containing protein TIM barrel [Isosphaera pallida ATCC 43644]